jgi:hypothetical protein
MLGSIVHEPKSTRISHALPSANRDAMAPLQAT